MSEEVITYPSTVNGGTTVILPSSRAACDMGQKKWDKEHEKMKGKDMKEKVQILTSYLTNRETTKTKKKTIQLGTWYKEIKATEKRFKACCDATLKGDPAMNEQVKDFSDQLVDLALMLEPSLSSNEGGWQTSDQGPIADPALIGSGAPNPCFRRRYDGDKAKDGAGDGAYRIVICTDQPWFGNRVDNASIVLALITLLRKWRPVELWIQQGWVNNEGKTNGNSSGVTLFKLDCDGGVSPTQLLFWTSHPSKDSRFSRDVNESIGRTSKAVSNKSEVPSDLFLMGAWMKLYGIDESTIGMLPKEERMAKFGQYLVDTVKSVAYGEEE